MRLRSMNRMGLFILLIGAALTILPATASAFYHPEEARFMQRDPLGYASGDGYNLYQYVGSGPIGKVDPEGLRLQYKYIAIWFSDPNYHRFTKKPFGRPPNTRSTWASDHYTNNKMLKLLENKVEALLWKMGINAWRGETKNWPFGRTLMPILDPTAKRIKDDLQDLVTTHQWKLAKKRARRYGEADDHIVFVPGYIGNDKDGICTSYNAARAGEAKLIGVPRKVFMTLSPEDQTIVLVHEILHAFLGETVRPSESDPMDRKHDEEGLFKRYHLEGSKRVAKIGCLTKKALIKAGVKENEIDPSIVLP